MPRNKSLPHLRNNKQYNVPTVIYKAKKT